jgi:hypothetical protein
VDTLPKLFAKYQSDSVRMVEVLRLASHVDFVTYAAARLVPVSYSQGQVTLRPQADHLVFRPIVSS